MVMTTLTTNAKKRFGSDYGNATNSALCRRTGCTTNSRNHHMSLHLLRGRVSIFINLTNTIKHDLWHSE